MINEMSQLIYVDITEEMRQNAIATADKYKDNLTKSILGGAGTVAGCLGEEMFHKVFPFMERINSFDYDFIYRTPKDAILTFDIKTKERTVPPQLHYECSVDGELRKQTVDHYVFAQVMSDYERGWLLGTKKAADFYKESTLYPKGTFDPRNNYKFHVDTYNILISKLRPMTKPKE